MKIQLSDHFTYKKILRFAFPPIIMMVFTSIYGVVDGLFVSNFIKDDGASFTAINFIMPYLMMLGAIGFMFGTGGGALIAKHLGMGEREKANSLFSLFIYLPAILGVVVAIIGILLLRSVAIFLGAEPDSLLLENASTYGSIFLLGLPFYMLQMEFQGLFSTAEKPIYGLIFTVASGLTNIILDALFVAILSFGIVGAAVATVLSQVVGCVGPLIYFARKNSSLLRLTKLKLDLRAVWQACLNGSSELMSNISMSLVGMLYNVQLLKYAEGENGVAAYGVLMYVNFIFISVFIGYTVAVAPIMGYNYGAQRSDELKNVLKKSIVIIGVISLSMFVLSELLATPMSYIFVSYNKELFDLTKRAFFLYSFSFLFAGFAIFGSSFFTALNNGPISAFISFMRTLVFQVAAVLILPLIFVGHETDGIWLSIVVAEFLAVIVTVIFMIIKRKKYNY